MAETSADYLSIGEVLGILVEEFPDVTISKIRFLESQGLINPERTTSGYRKFHQLDVDLLRVILTEQRENYLPLRVIKDRIDSGEIDPSSEISRPEGIERIPIPDDPPPVSRAHPTSRTARTLSAIEPTPRPTSNASRFISGVVLDRAEYKRMTGLTEQELTELESYGIVAVRRQHGSSTYGDHEVAVGSAARILLRYGIDARHLRGWKTAAEREASLIEQLLAHQLRQRDSASRVRSRTQAHELSDAGAKLRAALMQIALDDLVD